MHDKGDRKIRYRTVNHHLWNMRDAQPRVLSSGGSTLIQAIEADRALHPCFAVNHQERITLHEKSYELTFT